MSRKTRPWYWKERKGWYGTVQGRRRRLGNSLKEARATLAALVGRSTPRPVGIGAILDAWLDWVRRVRAPDTFRHYQMFAQAFVAWGGDLAASSVNQQAIARWIDSCPNWNSTTRNAAIGAIQTALRWAEREGVISDNPLPRAEKPRRKTRATPLLPTEFEALLAAVRCPRFRDLIVLCYDCGARPQEINRLEARHLSADFIQAVIPAEEAKKHRRRTIYFPTLRAQEIVRRLASIHPTGPLLRNNRGNRWTYVAVHGRFRRLQQVVGRQVRQYDFRHGWITRKLVAGVDSHVVAKLAGHASTRMLDQVYSHITEDHDFMLREAAREAEGVSKQSPGEHHNSPRDSEARRGTTPDTQPPAPG